MRNADMLDLSVDLSPIAHVDRNPFQPFPPEEHESETESALPVQRPEEPVMITPVRRSLRIIQKTTTPLAKMHTPFPFSSRHRSPMHPPTEKGEEDRNLEEKESKVVVLANPHLAIRPTVEQPTPSSN